MFHRDSSAKTLLAVIAAIALAVLLLSPTGVSAQGTDPESVIKTLHGALNDKDVDAAIALVADDAVVTVIPPPPDTPGVFTGKEQIRAWYEGLVAQNFEIELSNFQVDGDNVTWLSKASIDDWRALGVAPLDFTSEGVVQDGLVKSYTVTMTEDSLARLGAALATLPTTGGAAFPSYAWLMVAVGLGATGVGWALWGRRRERSRIAE